MPLTLELPPQLEEELVSEAQKEGVSVTEHTTLLLYLATALLDEEQTLFQNAVKTFLDQRSLDADQVATVFEDLVRLCLNAPQERSSFLMTERSSTASPQHYTYLTAWRDLYMHQPLPMRLTNAAWKQAQTLPKPSDEDVNQPKDVLRRPTAMGKYAYVGGSSDDFAQQKQQEIDIEDRERP